MDQIMKINIYMPLHNYKSLPSSEVLLYCSKWGKNDSQKGQKKSLKVEHF